MNDQRLQLKRIALLVLILVIVPILFLVYQTISRVGKTPVNLIIAPSNALVLINDKPATRGINYLSPGEYSLSVTSEGYSSYDSNFTVSEDAADRVVVGLIPLTTEAEIEASNDPAFLEFEGASGDEARKEGLEFESKNPIVGYLPFRSPEFRIDYRLDEVTPDSVIVQITAESQQNRDLALEEISSWGIDLDTLKIEYLDWD